MAANRDDAIKCISVSQKHFNAGNLPSARKFAEKSIALYPTPEAKELLKIIEAQEASGPSTSTASTNGNAESSASGTKVHETTSGVRNRTAKSSDTANGSSSTTSEKREYTPEMLAVVKRVQKCKITEYYEILSLSKDCEEADIKKAYRKIALQLHPDKNGAPGADEAFKMVSKAFQVLSDPQKRAAFDRSGSDPESRSSGMAGFNPAGGGGFEGEMSPEDLFNMFFGGRGAQGGFGVFTTSFGPGGFRTTRVYNAGARARPRGDAQQDPRSNFVQLLPLLLLFFFSFLSYLPGMFTGHTPDPSFSFTPSSQFSSLRYTSNHNIPYYVHPPSFTNHPIYQSIPPEVRDQQQVGKTSRKLATFEKGVEERFAGHHWNECQRGYDRRQRRIDSEMGILGFGANWKKIDEIKAEKIESCEILRSYGLME
ncbi:DnaJ-domain-containing protein [Sistotremastrum suecicum HHB10207 ss-3]|uniref:DnaJ-domain-containing protein n=1 Tax=Sistotremastrum suecicum HHB10207 ss-3 TaxID=1314776 RepID=A0A166EAY9_9AGAM|nr:DnaJ-domain-containing protein [Sistotremastrum suecicum HHB10207 ss-3]